ncbi:MAG: hypothetical protein A2X36_01885 [Elusimicrobia bacterium GWA2_69_24]|nr:MAG: hypothetical protein A2X36_01885 [Elusimicrobia bacterium GWA2_69_24]HBL16520.1 hypothetical protein [Elusimicrobiota bacterium]
MSPRTRGGRTIAAGTLLLVLAGGLSLVFRGLHRPYAPEAPAYRQSGPAEAPIVIAEFSDFMCPACAAAMEPMQNIQRMFPGKVRKLFKHVPWDSHRWARPAAVAAECAGRQGKFWEFHDALFARRVEWTLFEKAEQARGFFISLAKEVRLDAELLGRCLEGPEAADAVDKDRREADDRFIRATPTFFINGRRYVGAVQLRTYGLNRIEDLLKKP